MSAGLILYDLLMNCFAEFFDMFLLNGPEEYSPLALVGYFRVKIMEGESDDLSFGTIKGLLEFSENLKVRGICLIRLDAG